MHAGGLQTRTLMQKWIESSLHLKAVTEIEKGVRVSKVVWGILSTAKIGREKVIPAMQKGKYCEIRAIASRDAEKARRVADKLGIPKAYGSYEELLADKEIQAVYNPMPNHLHVGWTVKAMQAGKHVLCEKPIAMTAHEAARLLDETKKHPHLKVMEAFMYVTTRRSSK